MTIRTKSAVIARNDIVKAYDGVSFGSSLSSNPYADYQALGMRVPKKKLRPLKKALKEEDWKEDNSNLLPEYVEKGGARFEKDKIIITVAGDGSIQIIGPKKAKPTTIPYYD